ncbi:MAG: NTP transferase domain-containing protein [Planctomycetes bacterium]|nr:NTP transferase domain-containing protein [Planctomycetota bacterium]
MNANNAPWVIVLAAGSGTRLSSLTVGTDGVVVPKQFCSLRGGRSLLLDTIDRALHLTSRERIVVVVAADHERWWQPQLACLPSENVIVQPRNRGTTAGLLLPLSHVLARDPAAHVAVLPSDHHVAEPTVLNGAMHTALRQVAAEPDKVVLLGISPDSPDTEYGWILPLSTERSLQPVAAFVEKPPLVRATVLMDAGAVWNSFLFAASARTLWQMCARHAPEVAAALTNVRRHDERSLDAVYSVLPAIDVSATVFGGSASDLLLLRVPSCGWTDLGTPSRVVECVRRLERRRPPQRAQWFATVDLARAALHPASSRLVAVGA